MTTAMVALREAESARDYGAVIRRLMAVMQTFRDQDRPRYQDPSNESFRATLLATAVSHGANIDLRSEFRGLGFPVDDTVYSEILARMTE
jgi:hypothetical protein